MKGSCVLHFEAFAASLKPLAGWLAGRQAGVLAGRLAGYLLALWFAHSSCLLLGLYLLQWKAAGQASSSLWPCLWLWQTSLSLRFEADLALA